MSRLHINIILLFFCSISYGQNNVKKLLSFADEQYAKGDYFYALEYYQKALKLDSNSIDILWKTAETYRAYKDYRNAEKYYAIVYDREEAGIYPSSILNLGLMQKMNGKYDEALETFKKAKKKYQKDKKGYLYKKAKQELVSTVWAKSNYIDSANVNIELLPETVNTKDAEFGHGIFHGQLVFSSLRGDSINNAEEVYGIEYHTNLYTSKLVESEFEQSTRLEDLFVESMNTGNGTFSLDGNRYYFSMCEESGYNYRCKIMVAYYNNGGWTRIDSLGSIINEYGTNTTMPCIANLDEREYLIFASDRSEGSGGLDLYYTEIRNGNQFAKVRPLKQFNSPDNDVTPWWDQENQRLYFSSSWLNGFGGHDVFYSEYKNGAFDQAINAGLPYNSLANDIYFFAHGDTAYVSSNRIGVNYSKNPTCCSDIFALITPVIEIPPTPEETLADLNKRLPVTLYFHNDIPDPKTKKDTTNVNYIDSYNDYTAMLDKYKKEFSKGLSSTKAAEAEEDIESFFIEYVDKGVADLQIFRDLLLKELESGARLSITVKGFASPLAPTDYNVHLTNRRINSLINYLYEYENGVFIPYLKDNAASGGTVIFTHSPFGEYNADQTTSDNPNDTQKSVYSRRAAKERKIEIQSVSYLDDYKELPFQAKQSVIDLGVIKPGSIKTATFIIENKSDKVVTLSDQIEHCDCLSVLADSKEILPHSSINIQVTFNSAGIIGHTVKDIIIPVEGFNQPLELHLSTEIKE